MVARNISLGFLRCKFIFGMVIEGNGTLNGYSIALIVSFKGIWLGT